MVAGYILNNAFSQTESNWQFVCSFIIDTLYLDEQKITAHDLIER